MNSVQQRVRAVQVRQQRQWLWECASTGVLAGGIAGCLMAMARLLSQGAFSWIWVVLAVTIPAITGVVVALVRSRSMLCAARLIDTQCNLKDRTQTALQFLHASNSDPLRRLQIEDAESHLMAVDPEKVTPITAPRSWRIGVIMSFVAVLLGLLTSRPEPLMASDVSNTVVQNRHREPVMGWKNLNSSRRNRTILN